MNMAKCKHSFKGVKGPRSIDSGPTLKELKCSKCKLSFKIVGTGINQVVKIR